MSSPPPSRLASPLLWYGLAILTVGYVAAVVVYRRFFHPLAKIPGPFLPAVTTLYQLYYYGRYHKQIEKLHQEYGTQAHRQSSEHLLTCSIGPVVRINPNEVHLSDPDNFDKIYSMSSKFAKSPDLYGAFCIPHATFCTPGNELHKRRRAALNPMFSRKMMLNLEDVVQDKARRLVGITERGIARGEPVDLHHAFRAVSVDVITEYAFDKSYSLLESPDLGEHFFAMIRGVGPAMWVFQSFQAFQALALKIPPWLAPYLSKPLGHVTALQMEGVKQIEDVRSRMKAGKLDTSRPTIFSELLNPENHQGYPVPTTDELKDEVYSILAAAADTTGNAMTTAAYYVMANKDIYKRLRAELLETFPDPNARLDFVTLERLPYLTGVIKEGLRLSFGVLSRLARITPEPGATFNGHYVPPGTGVGMSSWLMHRNEDGFPDPMKFDPERWLDPAEFRRIDKYMIPFGRGTRQCVGMPLAYCELYVTLGTFFHRFADLEVFETTLEDLEYEDFFASHNIAGRKWFKAVGPTRSS